VGYRGRPCMDLQMGPALLAGTPIPINQIVDHHQWASCRGGGDRQARPRAWCPATAWCAPRPPADGQGRATGQAEQPNPRLPGTRPSRRPAGSGTAAKDPPGRADQARGPGGTRPFGATRQHRQTLTHKERSVTSTNWSATPIAARVPSAVASPHSTTTVVACPGQRPHHPDPCPFIDPPHPAVPAGPPADRAWPGTPPSPTWPAPDDRAARRRKRTGRSPARAARSPTPGRRRPRRSPPTCSPAWAARRCWWSHMPEASSTPAR
jgi:hypothetical protein